MCIVGVKRSVFLHDSIVVGIFGQEINVCAHRGVMPIRLTIVMSTRVTIMSIRVTLVMSIRVTIAKYNFYLVKLS